MKLGKLPSPLDENKDMVPGVAQRRSRPTWLNRAVIGMGVASFLSDAGHEMATTILPAFLTLIEGLADALSSFVKLFAGWYSDRIGHRKSSSSADTCLPVWAPGSWLLPVLGRLYFSRVR